jgi:pimeloyl-ACP methyl ester carboxylesterase
LELVYIHGAQATGHSFKHIREQLSEHASRVVEYNSDRGFFNNLSGMTDSLQDKTNIVFIAHSLGGVYAIHLADRLKGRTLGGITISTPHGGSQSAVMMQYLLMFTPSRLVNDITPTAAPITGAHKIKLAVPWINLVTTSGHSLTMNEPNDGVVTHTSMRHRKDVSHIDIEHSHFEVLQSPEALELIRKHLGTCYPYKTEPPISA